MSPYETLKQEKDRLEMHGDSRVCLKFTIQSKTNTCSFCSEVHGTECCQLILYMYSHRILQTHSEQTFTFCLKYFFLIREYDSNWNFTPFDP